MRDIKFRVFDTDTRKMNYAPTTTSVPEPQRRGLNECIYSFGQRIMQFTGLHDKNGKEIYEGDIVIAAATNWAIQYHDDSMGFVLTKDVADQDAKTLRMSHKREERARAASQIEVIGNIYENPELLNS
jgi:uncharacterized phage protein (TIGR01671 family)